MTYKQILSITLESKIFFFVTQTKVGRLNSIFYAEFNYVVISSIRQGFKVTRVWRLNKTCLYIIFQIVYSPHYLKNKSWWLSTTFCLWNFSSKCPAVFNQHDGTLLALIPLFHGGNFLVKSSIILIHPALFWSIVMKKFFMSPSLKCSGSKYRFSGFINGVFAASFCPGISDSRLGHFFLT